MRIRIKACFIIYLVVMLFLSGVHACIAMICALLIHEAGHYLVAKSMREPIESIEFTPIGGIIRYKAGCCPSKGVRGSVLALAGPFSNYAAILFMCACNISFVHPLCERVLKANITMMLVNMIPALPLDGGALLFSIGYYLFSISKLIGILCVLGMITGFAFCVFAFIGMIRYRLLNLSLIAVGAYLVFGAVYCRRNLLIQNGYTVLIERLEKNDASGRLNVYRVTGDEPLFSIMEELCRARRTIFLYETEEHDFVWISDIMICRAMLEEQELTVREMVLKCIKNERKSDFSLETSRCVR